MGGIGAEAIKAPEPAPEFGGIFWALRASDPSAARDPKWGLASVLVRSAGSAKSRPALTCDAIPNGETPARPRNTISNGETLGAQHDTSPNGEIPERPRNARPRIVIPAPRRNPRPESVIPAPGRNAHPEK